MPIVCQETNDLLPVDMAAALDGICCEISAEEWGIPHLHGGLALQNRGVRLFLAESGAMVHVMADDCPLASAPLGPSGPFDAALLAACAWGRRFHLIAAFPPDIAERIILPHRTG
jgi:hypothetical protein